MHSSHFLSKYLKKGRTIFYLLCQHDNQRPHLKIIIRDISIQILVDTGAAISCLSEEVFYRIHGHLNFKTIPIPVNTEVTEASDTKMEIVGYYQVQFVTNQFNQPKICYDFPFFIIRKLSMSGIMDIDFIKYYNITIEGFSVVLKQKPEQAIVKETTSIAGFSFGSVQIRPSNLNHQDYWIEQPTATQDQYQLFE